MWTAPNFDRHNDGAPNLNLKNADLQKAAEQKSTQIYFQNIYTIEKPYPWLRLQLDLHSTPNGLPRGEQQLNMGLGDGATIKVKAPLTMKLSTRDLRRHGWIYCISIYCTNARDAGILWHSVWCSRLLWDWGAPLTAIPLSFAKYLTKLAKSHATSVPHTHNWVA